MLQIHNLPAVRKNWFLIGILLVIIIAYWKPALGSTGGPLSPEVTIKYIAVSIIFFNSGLSLKSEDLSQALFHGRLHVFIQGFTLLCVPVLLSFIVKLLEMSPMDTWVLKGLLVVGSMPPPVSSAVILTKAVGGNEAGAIFNSAFGSFLGIVVTPLWLLYFLGHSAAVSIGSIFQQLTLTVVLPLLVGQIMRSKVRNRLDRLDIPFGSISSGILLLIIYTTFCDTFRNKDVGIDSLSLISVTCIIIILQFSLLLLTFYLSTLPVWQFEKKDVVCCMFCGTHKSLTLGMPILKVMFSDHPQLSIMTIPLLVYHPTQILLGGILVPTLTAWMNKLNIYKPRDYDSLIKSV